MHCEIKSRLDSRNACYHSLSNLLSSSLSSKDINNNYYYYYCYLLQLGCYPVAVVILLYTKYEIGY